MKNRGVLGKLLLLVGISVVAFCAVGIFGIVSNKRIHNSVDRVRLSAEQFQKGALNITDPLSELRQLNGASSNSRTPTTRPLSGTSPSKLLNPVL